MFANSHPSASNFKSFSRSLEKLFSQYVRTKYHSPYNQDCKWFGNYCSTLIRYNRVFDVHKWRAIYGNFAVAMMMMMSKRGFLHYTVRKTLFRIFAFLRSPPNLKLHFFETHLKIKSSANIFIFLQPWLMPNGRHFLWFKHLQFLTFQTKCTSKLQLLEPIALDLINIKSFVKRHDSEHWLRTSNEAFGYFWPNYQHPF